MCDAERLLHDAPPPLHPGSVIFQGKTISDVVKLRVNAVGLVKGKKFVDAPKVFFHAFNSVLSP